MKIEIVEEYHRGGSNFYGNLAVIHYLDDIEKDPRYGRFNVGISMDYYEKAVNFMKNRYGKNFEILESIPDLVVRIGDET